MREQVGKAMFRLGTALSRGSNPRKTSVLQRTRSFYPPTVVGSEARFADEEVLREENLVLRLT